MTRTSRLAEVRRLVPLALLALAGAASSSDQAKRPLPFPVPTGPSPQNPREWLPRDEELRFNVEVTVGPVRDLDVGSVRLSCVQTPQTAVATEDAAASLNEEPLLVATIEGLARGVYLGREVNHIILVHWFEGTQPRIDYRESLRGSHTATSELRIGEFDSKWKLQYRKDRHCKGCENRAHFTKGIWPWSGYSHCEDCERPDHRVWKDYLYADVPPHTFDIVSALYYARGFLRGTAAETSISLANHDELWNVRLRRGESRRLDTPAGKFDCVRIMIGPEPASPDTSGKTANPRFDALFGLHGDISVWVDQRGGFPVVIEGTAPIGPFDLHVKASLTSHQGD